MWGLPIIISLFRNKFSKFNDIGAGMLDSIYHMPLKLLKSHILAWKRYDFVIFYTML